MRNQPLLAVLIESLRNKQFVVAFLAGALLVVLLLSQTGCPGPDFPGTSVPGSADPPTAPRRDDPPTKPTAGPGNYFFCFWNVENLFDDQDDGRKTRGDKEYDSWFAHDKAARDQKLKNLCEVLLPMNGGKGPDILCVCEIESYRAVEMLQEALNSRLDASLRYTNLVYKTEKGGGRNIAPAILTRLPVDGSRTRTLARGFRVLEGQVVVGGKPLVILASHWTSRISDKTGTRRAEYGDKLYGRFNQIYQSNPKVDLLVCGDFNDNPDDPSVPEHLRAIGDEAQVRAGGAEPWLFNVFAKLYKDGEASLYFGPKPYLFDQICVSPGMLDGEGWTCDVSSAAVVKEMATVVRRTKRPNRFGSENDKRSLDVRGASDHFPVTVTLRVE